jgi:hypothetical protein
MGLDDLGLAREQWGRLVNSTVNDQGELIRRRIAKQAVCLYKGDIVKILEDLVTAVFEVAGVREDLIRLIPLVGTASLLRWISDDIARPLYSPAPTRRVYSPGNGTSKKRDRAPAGEQSKYNDLAAALRLNTMMDLGARLLPGCGSSFITGRTVRDNPHLDLVTSDSISVIVDPDRPIEALAFIIDSVQRDGTVIYTVVDDKYIFNVNKGSETIYNLTEHGLGIIPVVEIHPRARWGSYWAQGDSAPLVSATLKCYLVDLLISKKHKNQSHLQLAMSGDTDKSPKEQTIDETSVIYAEGNAQFQVLDLQASPEMLLKTKQDTRNEIAAMYGISAARMNQDFKNSSDEPLNERTQELLGIMTEVEQKAFALLSKLSNRASGSAIDQSLKLAMDYRPQTSRMTPVDELDYWASLVSAGYR